MQLLMVVYEATDEIVVLVVALLHTEDELDEFEGQVVTVRVVIEEVVVEDDNIITHEVQYLMLVMLDEQVALDNEIMVECDMREVLG